MYIVPVSWGGIPHYAAELANAMSNYCEVSVLKPEDSNDSLFSDGVDIYHISNEFNFSYKNILKSLILPKNFKNIFSMLSRKSQDIIDEVKPDVIHFLDLYPQCSLFIFVRRLKKRYPLVATLHSTFNSTFNAFLRTMLLENPVYGMVAGFTDMLKFLSVLDCYIVHSNLNKINLVERGIPTDRIFVVPHGAYTLFREKFRYSFNDIEEINNNRNHILFFGYIKKNKGIEYLIKSATILSEHVSDFKIIIAGEGKLPKMNELEDSKLRSKFIIYNNYISDDKIFKLFHQANVVVLPYTLHLGHSGVLSIALSFGKPVVVTNVGDFPNIVRDGCEGFVVPPRDHRALAKSILKIILDEKLRKKMSINALKRAEELSWDNIARKHITVYKNIIR